MRCTRADNHRKGRCCAFWCMRVFTPFMLARPVRLLGSAAPAFLIPLPPQPQPKKPKKPKAPKPSQETGEAAADGAADGAAEADGELG
jgi:hypothetical protein